MSMFKGAVKSLVPKVDLPGYFQVTSTPTPKGLTINVVVNAGGLKTYSANLDEGRPTLLDVVEAFPKIDTSKFNMMVRTMLSSMKLPCHWVLECKGAPGATEGFLITLDVFDTKQPRHWEKVLEISSMQLSELVEVLDWVKEANKVVP